MELSTIIRALSSAAQTVLKKFKPLIAERAVGKAPEKVRPADDSILEGAIQRLSGGRLDDSFVVRFAKSVPHLFITPKHLDTPNVVNWLNDGNVKRGLMDAARMKSLGSAIPEEIFAQLQARYVEVAMAGPREAGGVVLDTIAILAESINARVEDSGTASLVVASHRALSTQMRGVQDQLHSRSCLTKQMADEIISVALENNVAWLSQAFCNKKRARSAFGQALSPGDESVSRTIDRKDLRIRVANNVFGKPDGAVIALLGADGNGKSWILAQAWIHQSDRPLTVIVVPDDINGLPSLEYCQDLLISKLLTQTGEIPTHESKELWLKHLQRWQSQPDITVPRLVVFMDGVNQRESVNWVRFIDAMSEVLAQIGGRLVFSCRRVFYRDLLENKLLSRVIAVEVPEWTDLELDELLNERGTSISALDAEVVRSLRNPRIFGVAATLFNSEEITAFAELSISRLLFEHIRSGSAAEGTKVSVKQFTADICTHADNIVQRLKQQSDDINEFDMPVLVKAGGTSQAISEQFVITSAGRFFKILEEDPNKYLLKDEGLPLALGLTLVRTARDAFRKKKSVEDALSNILEPIAALDRTSDILMGAILAAVLEESPLEIVSPLVRCFVMLQNIDSLRYPEFRSLFGRSPRAFIAALEDSSLSRDIVSNLSWLTDAVDDLRGNEAFELELSASIHRWLNTYSLAPERMVLYPNTSEHAVEREKKTAEREQQLSDIIASLSEVELDLLKGMIRVDRGDYSQLSLLAFHALAGRSLAPFATSVHNWCFSTSLNGGYRNHHEVFDSLLHFNLVDWEATRDALRESAKLLRQTCISRTGQWALVYVLRATGDSEDAKEANAIAEELTKDRERMDGWRRIEDYCATDPCDPSSEEPDNIDQTALSYRAINPAKLSHSRSATLEDHFFSMAKPGLARFRPDAAIEALRALADEAVMRAESEFRLAAYLLESHTIGLEDRVAKSYVEKAAEIAKAALDAGEDGNNESWVTAQHALLVAFAHMNGDEQFNALLNHPDDRTILRNLCDLFLPVEESILECALDKAVQEDNQVVQFRILCFAEYSGTSLSVPIRETIITLLASEHYHVRLSVLSLIQATADPMLLVGLVKSGWSAACLDAVSQKIEIFHGSRALVMAAENGSITIEECLDRIELSAYETLAERLGPDAALAISDRLNTAILKAAEFQVTSNLPHIEQNIGGLHWPAILEVSEKVSQKEGLREQLERFADTSDAWYERQKQNQDATDRFEQDLAKVGAQLIIQSVTIRLILSIDKVAPALVDSWHKLFLKLDSKSFNNVHNIASLIAETISKRDVVAGLTLFERLRVGSPDVRVTLGRDKVKLDAVSIWRAADSNEIKELCFARLDSIDNDHELAMEVLAAIEAQRENLVREYVVDRRQRLEPAYRARATMVAGLSPDENWAIETISMLKDEHGFLHQAYIAAKYAMDRHQWSRHWASQMRTAADSVELWRYTVLLSKIADGRFNSLEVDGDTPSTLIKRFGPTLNRQIRNRISKWKNKRKSKLFGMRVPNKMFITGGRVAD
ncbi:hypothetical protein [Pseudomonas fluorescens]|uniref:NACHT domain-containing protein n=1 Tax=Pseudomonas fluorescens TaxID=294 RepID=A0A5E7C270_PSEFL|nr:hypothetical protein [Pseudomonas fluorescens]VVN98566.1 hypothetical protein PS723_02454 [Pseudomonas fluorescens]